MWWSKTFSIQLNRMTSKMENLFTNIWLLNALNPCIVSAWIVNIMNLYKGQLAFFCFSTFVILFGEQKYNLPLLLPIRLFQKLLILSSLQVWVFFLYHTGLHCSDEWQLHRRVMLSSLSLCTHFSNWCSLVLLWK